MDTHLAYLGKISWRARLHVPAGKAEEGLQGLVQHPPLRGAWRGRGRALGGSDAGSQPRGHREGGRILRPLRCRIRAVKTREGGAPPQAGPLGPFQRQVIG